MVHILHVVGARPNFMKVAPVMLAAGQSNHFQQTLVHTGQHYDTNMSDVFFEHLGLPEPDVNLGVGSGSHAQQTGQIMMALEPVVLDEKPDLVLVYGDVNSTAAAALVCAKLGMPVGHVEAGLRSLDRSMPEEINRLVTDQLSDLLFAPSADGVENLRREGVAAAKVHLVGNVMIDSLVRLLPAALARWQEEPLAGWAKGPYVLVTLHRPSNVDDPDMLAQIVTALQGIARQAEVIFPVHPRTRRRIEEAGLSSGGAGVHFLEPLGYLDFLALETRARLVITDSGGVQEETTYLGVPCLTVRENTERPITVSVGTNVLVGRDVERLKVEAQRVLDGKAKKGRIPPLWDGRAGERIVDVLAGGA